MTFWGYYLGMSEFERITHDTKSRKIGTQVVYEKSLPILLEESKDKIKEIKNNVKIFKEKTLEATKPVKCLFGKRTSCFCCFKSLFGEVK